MNAMVALGNLVCDSTRQLFRKIGNFFHHCMTLFWSYLHIGRAIDVDSEKPENSEHSDEFEQLEKCDQSKQSKKIEISEKSRSEKSELIKQSDRSKQSKKFNQTEKSEKFEISEKSEIIKQPDETEQSKISHQSKQSEKFEIPEKSELIKQSDKSEHSKKFDQSKQLENFEISGKSELIKQSNETEQSEKSDQSEQSEKFEIPEKSELVKESDESEHSKKFDQSKQLEKFEISEKSELIEQSDKTEQSKKSDQSKQSEKFELPEKFRQSEKSELTKQSEQSGNSKQTKQPENSKQSEKFRQIETFIQSEKSEQSKQSKKSKKSVKFENQSQTPIQPEQFNNPEQSKQSKTFELLKQSTVSEQSKVFEQLKQSRKPEQPKSSKISEQHAFVRKSEQPQLAELSKQSKQPGKSECPKQSKVTPEIRKMENLGFSADKDQSDDQVRVLTLNKGEHQDGNLYKLKKGWIVEFRLGASLLGHNLDIFTNHPLLNGNPFERRTYYQLPWHHESAFLRVLLAGSFHYYVAESSGANAGEIIASGYLLVDPEITVGKNGQPLPLDCIQCQTVLSKLLGPFSTWEEKLKVSYKSGYNTVHFTPIQAIGASKSAYSLSDQLKLNPTFHDSPKKETTFDDVEKFIQKMRDEWNTISICDIVLNHTANESPFLTNHPECTYNCKNCPHLRPAYILDAILFELTIQVSSGQWEHKGIPTVVDNEDHLNAIRHALHTHFLPLAKVQELYIIDINEIITVFLNHARNQIPEDDLTDVKDQSIVIIRDPEYRRMKATIDMQLALKLYNIYRVDCFDEDTRLQKCAEELRNKLQQLNDAIVNEIQNHLNAAVENTIAGIRYFRVQADGPKLKEVSERNPLAPRYFTDYGSPRSFAEREEIMYSDSGCYLMAHNGWVMNGDPLKNFADPDSNVYIRRELISWADSVKLRYGEKPEDCPALWDRMTKYVQQIAKIFDGVRLDNCHSTPIPVAEYLLDAARQVRPDLYVVAELFTNSDQKDNIFVNRLGITSLIREAMSAWDSHEEGRLVYRYGGEPVGAFIQARHRPLVPGIAHALFLDQTHDNPSPVEKRSVFDLLPNAALVSTACCASGSNRGYDELVPHHIHVVDEDRQYTAWTEDENLARKNEKYVGANSGIISAKKALNDLHYWLGQSSFTQVFVDQMDVDVVAVTRHSPVTHESVVLVAFTAFRQPDANAHELIRHIRPLRVEGVVDEIILEASLSHEGSKIGLSRFRNPENYAKNKDYINGYSEYEVDFKEHIQVSDSSIVQKADSGDPKITQLNFINFQPGTVIAIKVSIHANIKPALEKINNLILDLTTPSSSDLRALVTRMSFADLNRALYRCDQEERDETANKFGVYNIPGYGPLVYAGLQGVISLLADIRSNNDLGHPLCTNLRQGNWLIEYTWQRLKEDEGTLPLAEWLEKAVEPFNQIPRYLVPSYFDVIIVNLYTILLEHCFNLMSSFVKDGTDFTRLLSLVSVQVGGIIKSAQLPELSPNLDPPKPKVREVNGKKEQECLTLSAGLPHFAVGYMRNWGRDTFISLRGLLLLTDRQEEARFIILGYAGTLRHGLIPNLLDRGVNARFNCRDSVWWWLYTIQCYIDEIPDGSKILSDKVSRLFPTDDSPALPAGEVDQPLADVIQEALSVHFQGLCFRERNAGKSIDEHMTDRGFNNQIGVHPETGFVFGGNENNCGTWMDKMGSSEKAGNKSKPATPRDGSAVEIVGLSHSTLNFFAELYKQNIFPHGSVQRKNRDGTTVTWSYKQWADKIKENFEKYFYVNEQPTEGELRPDLIHRRGIYKDSHGATQPWADYQLRPNFPIAMVASPELFNPEHAWLALKKAEEILLGPLGMKTLDPADWAYDGFYNNANDGNDPKLAHGWNYHQGPEWVWPIGYFLRARLHFAPLVGGEDELRRTVASTEAIISRHLTEASTNHWRGLPELTNCEGEYCADSCRTQAWSASTILEVLYELDKLRTGLKPDNESPTN